MILPMYCPGLQLESCSFQVVLIGDGFAEGLGDWVVMGGTAGLSRQLEKQAGTDSKVRALMAQVV